MMLVLGFESSEARSSENEIVDGQGVMAIERDGEIGFLVAVYVELNEGLVAAGDGAEITFVAGEGHVHAEKGGYDAAELLIKMAKKDMIGSDFEIVDRVARGFGRAAVLQRLEGECVDIGAPPQLVLTGTTYQLVRARIPRQQVVSAKAI
jgi:hypothetical protein